MLNDYYYGRNDAETEKECGSHLKIQSNKSVDKLEAMGFTKAEMVALVSIETFDLPGSGHSRLDNCYYKSILSGGDGPFKKYLLDGGELQEVVQEFADDNSAYHKTFKQSFNKLVLLGHDVEKLTDIDEFMHDDPNFKLA